MGLAMSCLGATGQRRRIGGAGEYELAAFIRTEIERMVFSSACGGAKLSLDGFVKKETKKNPMLETLIVPDVWTSRYQGKWPVRKTCALGV